ncbi:hypothetical protein BKA04_000219 [Cryobacterium mesophilum]|nr:hypothetical protein [Terrimesophilobacter mesophilus]MBB5631996.1 hypothetical protein [Terrimesophilobacter mesophilus]
MSGFELASTGIDSAAMATGLWIGGGIFVVGVALYVFAMLRRRHDARR